MKALAIASGIVFWTLVLSVVVLLFLPGNDEGEPVATVAIQPAQPGSAPAPAAAPSAAVPGVGLPPGFSVTPGAAKQPSAPALAPPGQGTNMVPVTPGRAAVRTVPTPIPRGWTPVPRCCASSSATPGPVTDPDRSTFQTLNPPPAP